MSSNDTSSNPPKPELAQQPVSPPVQQTINKPQDAPSTTVYFHIIDSIE